MSETGGSGDTIPISDLDSGWGPTAGTANLGEFGLGFVLGDFAKGQSVLLTVAAKENAVASATLLNSGHRCGSNVTATLLPVCYHGGQFGMLRFAVSM